MQLSDIRIERNGEALVLVQESGTRDEIEARVLWQECPSALRRRQRLEAGWVAAPLGIQVVRATPIGNYALNIAFSDGHDRGVYPWSLLAELARRPGVADYLIPVRDAVRAGARPTLQHSDRTP